MSTTENLEKRIRRLKAKIIYEQLIIGGSIFLVSLYIVGLISPNFYFSDFIESTMIVLYTFVTSLLIYQLLQHDLISLAKAKEEEKS